METQDAVAGLQGMLMFSVASSSLALTYTATLSLGQQSVPSAVHGPLPSALPSDSGPRAWFLCLNCKPPYIVLLVIRSHVKSRQHPILVIFSSVKSSLELACFCSFSRASKYILFVVFICIFATVYTCYLSQPRRSLLTV